MGQSVEHQTIKAPLVKTLGEKYLSYALSTIVDRSLPDVRDGLKPVHRRLLFAMHQLKLAAHTPHKKSARVVGDVIGKFHPHGEMAVYDALVRLAQDFAVRYPMVDGQGNFGNIDGDNAAAMRYTEARLTLVAQAMLEGLDDDAIDFRATYDSEGQEPIVLPARFPNLLANGATGIAVGMATNIPPHNVDELCQALIHLVDKPNATVRDLMQFIKGPDLPTGGIMVEPFDNIVQAYETGRGSMRLRAKWEEEKLKNGTYQLVIHEVPYQVAKGRLIEQIADQILSKKLPLLADIRDESDEQIRIVLEPRTRHVDPVVLMESLFKSTDLEVRIHLNMNVLDPCGVPRVMSLKDVLTTFIEHRLNVILRQKKYRLANIQRRLEVLKGYLIVHLHIDEVIQIIREEDEPGKVMMARWGLSEVQVESILNMRLRSLRRLEEIELKKEHDSLEEEANAINALLGDEKLQQKALKNEFKEIQKSFGASHAWGKRRTDFADAPKDVHIPIEAVIEREAVTVVCSNHGWIRALKGHISDLSDVKYKEGDEEGFVIQSFTTDKLLVLTNDGKCYTLSVDKLPRGRGHGEPLRLMIDVANDVDIVTMFLASVTDDKTHFLVASSDAYGFLIAQDDMIAQTKSGKQILNLNAGQKAVLCKKQQGDLVAIIGSNRKLLIFGIDELPVMGRGKGVRLQKYKDATLSDLVFLKKEQNLSWRVGERVRTETDLRPWTGKRGQIGKLPPISFPRSNKFLLIENVE